MKIKRIAIALIRAQGKAYAANASNITEGKAAKLPACYFNKQFEATYDRSVNNYLRMKGDK